MSLTVLPVFAIPLVWNWLREPPPSTSVELSMKLHAFSDYMERTWIHGDFQPSLWSHFDHLGPRTTNVAEGWHNSLNSRFGLPHPSLRLFLDCLQKLQHEVQCREIQLAAGRPAKQRKISYRRLDQQLRDAKVSYNVEIGRAFCSVFPNPEVWPIFHYASLHFLDRATYLLGCK